MKDNRGIYGFLTEFVIMIVVFALISIVSVNLFSNADSLDEDTEILNSALLSCENVAEKMKTYNGEELKVYLEGYNLDKIMIEVNEVNGKNILYQTVVSYEDEGETILELKVSSIGGESYE